MMMFGAALIVGSLMGSTVATMTGESWQTPYFLAAGFVGAVLLIVGLFRSGSVSTPGAEAAQPALIAHPTLPLRPSVNAVVDAGELDPTAEPF
jgi:uncharacterized membrane protein